MRILKVGTRGEDVLLWQHFLMQLRATQIEGCTPPSIRMDGIFGRETRRATTAFQVRYRLRADGLVGRETFGKARELGLGKIPAGATGIGEFLRPLAPQLVAEPPPLVPPNEPRPAPPATTAPPSRDVTFARLRAEAWQSAAGMGASLTAGGAVFQLLKDGAGDYVYDEYSVVVDAMPEKKTPESFLLDLTTDLNGTIDQPDGRHLEQDREARREVELQLGPHVERKPALTRGLLAWSLELVLSSPRHLSPGPNGSSPVGC